MNGVQRFESQVRELGADGAEVLRRILLAAEALPGLEEPTREALRAEARVRFGQREFSLADAAKVKMQGSWDLAGGAATRDLALHGASVAVFISLASAPEEFAWRMTEAGIIFRSRQ